MTIAAPVLSAGTSPINNKSPNEAALPMPGSAAVFFENKIRQS